MTVTIQDQKFYSLISFIYTNKTFHEYTSTLYDVLYIILIASLIITSIMTICLHQKLPEKSFLIIFKILIFQGLIDFLYKNGTDLIIQYIPDYSLIYKIPSILFILLSLELILTIISALNKIRNNQKINIPRYLIKIRFSAIILFIFNIIMVSLLISFGWNYQFFNNTLSVVSPVILSIILVQILLAIRILFILVISNINNINSEEEDDVEEEEERNDNGRRNVIIAFLSKILLI